MRGDGMNKQLSIYDISKLSGVSISTVSRVLNGSQNVNGQTRERVEAVIRKYGYVPRQSARNFREQPVFAIGLMMDDIRNPYMSGLAYAINHELSKERVNTILCNIDDVESEFLSQLDNLIEKKVSGVILMGSLFQNHLCRVALERKYSGFPFVAINGHFALPNVHEVIQDQQHGTRDAVAYLHRQERRHIGWVYRNQSASDMKKNAGYLAGIREFALEPRSEEVAVKSLAEGREATRRLLTRFPDTDAVIYSSDTLAVGGAHYLNDIRRAIPEDVAIIGFNNSSSARECYPPLTSIDNSLELCGKAAADLMLRVIDKQSVDDVIVPCGLAIRESTEKRARQEEC